jgi:CPA2 family monovalent cation:H+ antiporter-2
VASLLGLGELLVAAAVAGVVAARTRLPVVPLYVLAGTAVGPHVAGRAGLPAVAPDETITLLAEIGIVLLLLFLGMEFDLGRLVAARDRVVRAGGVDLLVNLPLGVAAGLALGWGPVAALLVGGIVYISSSAIITKSLLDLGWIANPESDAILGTLVAEDLVIAVYLAVVAALVVGGGSAVEVGRSVGIAAGFLGGLVVVVRYGGRLFEAVAGSGTDEAVVVRTAALVVPVAGAALALGVSEAVAAFFVGMGFGATDGVETVERLLAPLRDLFAAVFFVWIGLGTDPVVVAGVAAPVLVVGAVTMPAKVGSGYLCGRAYDLSPRRSLRTGLALVARGEFSLVIAALAATSPDPLVSQVVPAFAVGYVLLTSTVGTLLMGQADRVGALLGVVDGRDGTV